MDGMESTNNDRKNETEIDIREICHVLLHRLWIILLAGIIMAVALGLINKYYITPVYESTTKIYVMHRQDESKTTITDLQTGAQLTKDYQVLVTSRPVMEKVIDKLMLDMKPGELMNMIYVVNPDGTRIIEISVANENAAMAKLIADAVAIASAEQMISIMEIEGVNIVEYGELPEAPTSPNVRRSAVSGGMIGVLIASLAIIAVHLLNDNIRTPDDVEKYLQVTTLGIIPVEADAINRKKRKSKKLNTDITQLKENWDATN